MTVKELKKFLEGLHEEDQILFPGYGQLDILQPATIRSKGK